MTAWQIILSQLLTNELRLVLGLYFAARGLSFALEKKTLILAVAGGVVVTGLQGAGLPAAGSAAAEVLVLTGLAWTVRGDGRRRPLFLFFFYEVGVGLWDFLLQAALGILFRAETFLDPTAPAGQAGIWLVRLVLLGAALVWTRKGQGTMGVVSGAAILGLFGAVTLSEQTILPLSEDQMGTWVLLAMVLLFAVLVYRLQRQRELEAEVAQLKQAQAESLQREYQALRRTYEDNAKLYHDLHNHIEAIYHCLTQGDTQAAQRYCADLRTPIQALAQTVYTGDTATDCLIANKLALAQREGIDAAAYIEFPRNTDLRSVDLTAILGNLLDNALEAARTAPACRRFLRLTIRRIHAMLVIKVENGTGSPPPGEDLQTTKADKTMHGWGLKSVRTAAERYDGTLSTSYQDGVFRAVVTLSFCPVRTQ
ncbi:MAG TPA: GHKL domain-containing protein [Candidatus Evtepia faecigallinarum]|nr:GHKL domain-containing protein [Candidatus Evtepia faecigallinarum]